MASTHEFTKMAIRTTQYRNLINYNKLEPGQTETAPGMLSVEEQLAAIERAPGYRKVVRQAPSSREFFNCGVKSSYPSNTYSSYRARD